MSDTGSKVADFGLVQVAPTRASSSESEELTQYQEVVGTPAYMAPEQRDEGVTSSKSDLYSAAVIIAEMATGKRPKKDQRPNETMASLVTYSLSSRAAVREFNLETNFRICLADLLSNLQGLVPPLVGEGVSLTST